MSFVKKLDNLGNPIAVGMSKLMSVPNDKWLEYTNAKKETKRFKYVTIEVTAPSGKVTQLPATLHEKSIDNMSNLGSEFKLGEKYLTTLQQVERRDGNGYITLARISHVQNAIPDQNVLAEFFAEEGDMVEAPAEPIGAEA